MTKITLGENNPVFSSYICIDHRVVMTCKMVCLMTKILCGTHGEMFIGARSIIHRFLVLDPLDVVCCDLRKRHFAYIVSFQFSFNWYRVPMLVWPKKSNSICCKKKKSTDLPVITIIFINLQIQNYSLNKLFENSLTFSIFTTLQ